MKIFVCEFITGGGLYRAPLSSSLVVEGGLMRDALLRDLSELSDVAVMMTHDARLPAPEYGVQSIPINTHDDVWQVWDQCMAAVDAVWLIAPETGGVLTRLTAMVNDRHKILLGCGIEAVRLAASKYATYRALQAAGVDSVPTYTFESWSQDDPGPWVAKADDGAGCENNVYFESSDALLAWMRQGRASTHIIQPYQKGIPASICLLCREGRAWLLSCNTQKITLQISDSGSGKFSYNGSVLNGMAQHWQSFEEVASRVALVMPGLSGYVGIDVLIDDENIHVLEINPRLTTSYVGLSSATGCNVARLVIDLLYTGVDATGGDTRGVDNGGVDNSALDNKDFQFPQKISRNVVEISLND